MIYFDVSRNGLTTEKGIPLTVWPTLYYEELGRFDIILTSGSTPFDLSPYTRWRAALDTDLRHDTPPMIETPNGGISVITREDGQPYISVRMDTFTEEFRKKIDGKDTLTATFNLYGYKANSERADFVMSFSVTCRNIIAPTQGTPPTTPAKVFLEDLANSTPDGAYMRQIIGGVRSWVKGVLSLAWDNITGKPEAFPPSPELQFTELKSPSQITLEDLQVSNAFNISQTVHVSLNNHPNTFVFWAKNTSGTEVRIQAMDGVVSLKPGEVGKVAAYGFYIRGQTIEELGHAHGTGEGAKYGTVKFGSIEAEETGVPMARMVWNYAAPKPKTATPENNALAWNGTQFVNVPTGGKSPYRKVKVLQVEDDGSPEYPHSSVYIDPNEEEQSVNLSGASNVSIYYAFEWNDKITVDTSAIFSLNVYNPNGASITWLSGMADQLAWEEGNAPDFSQNPLLTVTFKIYRSRSDNQLRAVGNASITKEVY